MPLTILVDEEAMAWKRACTIRSDQWSGWTLGERVARLWGHGVAERGGWKTRLIRWLVDRESYLNTLGIDRCGLKTFADHLRRNPPGFFSATRIRCTCSRLTLGNTARGRSIRTV